MLAPGATRLLKTVALVSALGCVVASSAGCSQGATSAGGFSIFDIADGLFISDFTGNSIPVYGSPFTSTSAPVFTMHLTDRIALARDGTSNLITEQSNGSTGILTEFRYPLIVNPLPSATVNLPGPSAITDYNGNFYIGAGNTVSKTALPLTSGSTFTTFSSGFANVRGLSYVNAGLLVSDQGNATLPPGVTILNSSGSPIVKITNGITNARGVCGDGANSFFVIDPVASKALLYTTPFTAGSTPSATITTGLSAPSNCKMNLADNIAIFVNMNSVVLYQAPYSNSSMPFATITNGLNGPSDALYALNIRFTF
jgi:hypothetical protein